MTQEDEEEGEESRLHLLIMFLLDAVDIGNLHQRPRGLLATKQTNKKHKQNVSRKTTKTTTHTKQEQPTENKKQTALRLASKESLGLPRALPDSPGEWG